MTATSQPTLDALPNIRNVALVLAADARENLDGVDVVSVGPLYAEQVPGGVQYSVVVIVPDRTGKDCVSSLVTLDIAQDPLCGHRLRTGGRVKIFWRHADARQILPKRMALRAHGSGSDQHGSQSWAHHLGLAGRHRRNRN
jgi:hypothetical protein